MEKQILFNTEMVKAILDGRKTSTRRIIKPQPKKSMESGPKNAKPLAFWKDYSEWVKPPYQIGNILWVRETWQKVFETEYDKNADGYCINIRKLIPNFDNIPKTCVGLSTEDSCSAMKPRNKYYVYKSSNIKYANEKDSLRWQSSIHMPKEAARIFLKVTDIKVQRIQDITWEETLQEGIDHSDGKDEDLCNYCNIDESSRGARNYGNGPEFCIDSACHEEAQEIFKDDCIDCFSELWNSTVKKKDLDKYG